MTTLRLVEPVDPDIPGSEFRRVGLSPARFGVDGSAPFFWGYHDDDRRWNGWSTPRFRREVAGLIVNWVNDCQPDTAWWEGVCLCLCPPDADEVQRVEPDELGLYSFDGWAWCEEAGDD